MAIVLFTSVSGSPGVTSTVVACTLGWHRPALLLEADTSKSSSILPGFLRGQVTHSLGLSPLSLAQQRRELNSRTLLEQAVMLANDRYFVSGFNSPAAGIGTTSLWGALGVTVASLESAGIDVLIDMGRLAPNDPREALLQIADSVIIIARPVLPDIAAAAARLPEIKSILRSAGHDDYLGLWLIEAEFEGYGAKEIFHQLDVPVLAQLRNDQRAAAVYSLGAPTPARFDRSPYLRTMAAALSTLEQNIQERRDRLGIRPAPTNTEVSA